MNQLTRRSFLTTFAAAPAVLASGVANHFVAADPGTLAVSGSQTPWYANAYRRAVIDMHIPDWDDAFFAKFDPEVYVRMLVQSRAQSIVCYCQSHVGLFNYPTRVGKQHAGWHGRNVLQEMIDGCHQHHIAVVLYCSLIFDRWAGDTHPEWRIRTWDGKIQGEGGRHAVLCPNSPYREYVRRFVEEVCATFDFEGIRFDMTFWPTLCFCQHCQDRFAQVVGGPIPTTIDWLDERWVAFQRCRERWLVEFAEIPTATVKRLKPGVSVEHQSSTYPLHWNFGVTEALAPQNDFLQGDFYGDQLQGSFVRKLLERISPHRPFGYETSVSVELRDHTAMKAESLLEAKASAAIADAAAFIFIDAIDPIGTVNPRAHRRMGRIFDRLMPYYPHLGGDRVADVAIYYSLESKFDMSSNGRHVREPDLTDAHTKSSMQVASALIRGHLPFGVITKTSLGQLPNFDVLVLSNVNMMDDEECQRIRAWVESGGKLIATGGSSLVDKHGRMRQNFMLADVFGIDLVKANWTPRKHYISPTAAGYDLFPEFDRQYPAYCSGYGFEVRARSGSVVLATTTEPWLDADSSKFSSIHSDPPWKSTANPEIVHHHFGKGACIYCSSLIETMDVLRDTFVRLVRRLHADFRFEVDAPACVEATLFRQPDRKRYLFCLVNFQKEMPNIPIESLVCRIRLDANERVGAVRHLPDAREVMLSKSRDGQIEFVASRLETLSMYEVEITD
jgi:hypothetical protein